CRHARVRSNEDHCPGHCAIALVVIGIQLDPCWHPDPQVTHLLTRHHCLEAEALLRRDLYHWLPTFKKVTNFHVSGRHDAINRRTYDRLLAFQPQIGELDPESLHLTSFAPLFCL